MHSYHSGEKTNPKISVILPVYNGEKYIYEAISSVLNQTYDDFELLIIVENGTNKASLEILDSFDDNRIRLIFNQKRLGLAESLNVGIREASGEYVARMDADDICMSDRFRQQNNILISDENIGLCGTGIRYIDGDGVVGIRPYCPTSHDVICWYLIFQNALAHSTIMVRKDLLIKVGGYEVNAVCEDYELWTRLVQITKIVNIAEPLVFIRIHGQNISVGKKIRINEHHTKISADTMSKILNRQVSLMIVQSIDYPGQSINKNYAIEAYELIESLLMNYLGQHKCNTCEKKQIETDAGIRIFTIGLDSLPSLTTFVRIAIIGLSHIKNHKSGLYNIAISIGHKIRCLF